MEAPEQDSDRKADRRDEPVVGRRAREIDAEHRRPHTPPSPLSPPVTAVQRNAMVNSMAESASVSSEK